MFRIISKQLQIFGRIFFAFTLILCLSTNGFCKTTGWEGLFGTDVKLDTLYFDNNLSALDDTAQKAFETLDELIGGGSSTWTAAGDSGAGFLVGDAAETVILKGAGGNSVSAASNIWTITWSSSGLTWAGNAITTAKGGFGLDTSTWTGIGAVNGGTWTAIGIGSANQILAINIAGTGYNWTADATGGAGASTWTATADSGTDQLIEDTNTVKLAGGTAISTTIGATDTWTINWTSANQTWNGNVIGNTKGGTGQDSSGWTEMVKVGSGTWTTATADTDYLKTLAKDLVTTTPLSGGTDNILPGADADITIAISKADTSTNGYLWSTDWNTFNGKMAGTLLKDIVAGVGLSGGENDVLPGADADTTLTFDATELDALTWDAGTLTNFTWTFDLSGTDVAINWTSAKMDVTGTVNATTLTEGGNAVYNSTEVPGGELGGTWASPTIDDSVAVTSWNLTTPTITTSLTTSTPTTLSAAELDRLDGLAGIITTDATACTDLEGVGLAIDTAVLKFAPAEVIAPTWGAGATQVWTFDLATDYTVTWTTGLATFSGDITVSGGDVKSGNIALTIGDATTDSITFSADGTGNAEFVFPADVIGVADIDWGTGAGQIMLSKSFVLSGTISNTSDFGTIWKTKEAITISNVCITCAGGAASWSIVGNLDECDTNGANCATVDSADITCTQGTEAADDASLSNASIDANDWIGWHTTSQTWTTGGNCGITFYYTK